MSIIITVPAFNRLPLPKATLMSLINNETIAILILRIFLGILFFMQGYDKLFRIGMKNVINAVDNPLEDHHLPSGLISLASYYTSIIELICGGCLIVGFFTNYALYLLGLDLLIVAFAFSIIKPMWDLQFVFPRLAILITLLLVPEEWNKLSIDYWLHLQSFK